MPEPFDDHIPSPPLDEEHEMPLERLISLAVASYLTPQKGDKKKLKALLDPDNLLKIAERFAATFRLKQGDLAQEVTQDLLAEMLLLEIKHQARELLGGAALREEKIFHICQFLEDDLHQCIDNAAHKAVDAGIREIRLLAPLAGEASLEINQILLNAKREFLSIEPAQGASEFDPKVRQAVAEKITALDTAYSSSAILEALAEKLGLDFITSLKARLQRNLLATLTSYKRPLTSGAALPTEITSLIKENSQLIDRAIELAAQRFPSETIRNAVLQDLEQLASHYTDAAFLSRHFPTPT